MSARIFPADPDKRVKSMNFRSRVSLKRAAATHLAQTACPGLEEQRKEASSDASS